MDRLNEMIFFELSLIVIGYVEYVFGIVFYGN